MNNVIEQILNNDELITLEEKKAKLREILQSIVLIGLSRTDFFSKAAFYGGTALRIFYDLNRYSEDLDFTLLNPDQNFDLGIYLSSINEVALSYGIELNTEIKRKNIATAVQSAFAKVNTYQTFLTFKVNEKIVNFLNKDEFLKVKFEIDTEPSSGFTTETRWLKFPEFAPVNVCDEGSLFGGKICAVLCRNYKNQVKGRDYYDFLFYIQRKVKPNLEYIRNKLIDNGKISQNEPFDINILKELLEKKFNEIDFEMVKNDARRFLFHNEDLSYFSKDLFLDCLKDL